MECLVLQPLTTVAAGCTAKLADSDTHTPGNEKVRIRTNHLNVTNIKELVVDQPAIIVPTRSRARDARARDEK